MDAKKIAEEIGATDSHNVSQIAELISAYAEERVKEAYEGCHCGESHRMLTLAKIRADIVGEKNKVIERLEKKLEEAEKGHFCLNGRKFRPYAQVLCSLCNESHAIKELQSKLSTIRDEALEEVLREIEKAPPSIHRNMIFNRVKGLKGRV